MKNLEKKSSEKKNELSQLNDDQILSVEGLLKVEGGVDNDEDWCVIGQCKSNAQKTCYTAA